MRFDLSTSLAITAGLLTSAGSALAQHDIPTDVPVSALLKSAQTYLAKGETHQALDYYGAAIARDPSNYLTLFKRATIYLSLGRAAPATDDFNKVLALKPGFEGAHLQLARLKLRAADWEAARAQYVAANKGSDSPEMAELVEAQGAASLAEAANKDGRWDECVANANVAIAVASRASPLRTLRAGCRFERGEIEEGMGDLQHVLQMRPGDTDPHVLISATAFYGLADFDNGLAQAKKCLHSDPESKVCRKLHKQQKLIHKQFSTTEAQLNKGQTTTAGRTLVGTADEPGLLANIRAQVDELRQHGRIPAKARARLYEKVVEMVCQAYSESNHREAHKHCDEALQLDPESFWGHIYRGKTLLKEDNFEAAIEMFNKAAQARPDKQDKVNPLLKKAQAALKRSKTKDYYKVLGVPSDADDRQIKLAYRKKTKEHHPDKAARRGVSKEKAEKEMAAINEAYEVLSNTELRARFDRGDDPNSNERASPFEGSPFGAGDNPFHMFQQQGGDGNFKFHFAGGAGGPFGF